MAGDFNQLDTSFLEQEHGLAQMVTDPTQCWHLFDKVFVSRPDLYNCFVIQSTLKTKKIAIILGQNLYDSHVTSIQRSKIRAMICESRYIVSSTTWVLTRGHRRIYGYIFG